MDDASLEFGYKIAIILILTLFLCLSALSYLRDRLNGKPEIKVDYIRHKLGATATSSLLDKDGIVTPKGWDYVVPISSAVMVTLLGIGTCLFANELLQTEFLLKSVPVDSLPAWHNILLTGLYQETAAEALHQRRWQSLSVMSLAFLGAFIWSAHNIIRRYINYDLMPVEYFHTALRLILAPFLALMLSFFFDAGKLGAGEWPPILLPVIAFMTGLIPAAVLFFLQDKFIRLLQYTGYYADHLPLSMIEGLNRFHEVRLSEAGVDNAQNLAQADLTELALLTPYPPEQLLDWIDQARLHLFFKHDLAVMRRHRFRTATDLVSVDDQTIKRLENDKGLPDLETVVQLIKSDPNQQRVDAWRNALVLRVPPATPPAIVSGDDRLAGD